MDKKVNTNSFTNLTIIGEFFKKITTFCKPFITFYIVYQRFIESFALHGTDEIELISGEIKERRAHKTAKIYIPSRVIKRVKKAERKENLGGEEEILCP